jgi:hypothetical protein
MLLFKKAFWEGLTTGAITLTFRRWDKARVRAGGRYRCHPIGVLEVDNVSTVKVATLSAGDATRAGFASRDELVAYLAEHAPLDPKTLVYRVELRHVGDGDRVEGALDEALSDSDLRAIREALARLDQGTPWTLATFRAIEKQPRVAASKLALALGRETAAFKADVVKLKKLGLTQSFEVGYEVTPRGRVYLASLPAQAKPAAVKNEAPAAAAMKWTKTAKGLLLSRVGPLSITIEPMGDGRLRWTILRDGKNGSEAGGVRSSLGAAKTAVEQFVRR